MTTTLFTALTVISGLAIGLKFADIDLAPVFGLRHRSFWTHGPLIVFLAAWLLSLMPWLYWFMVGFLPAHAIHLLADMFPRNWKGGAMVKLHPIKKELAPILSFLWLFAGAYVAMRQWIQMTGHAWGWL